MKLIRTEDAVGHVLCHDLTQIIKDEYKDARFRKGHVVTEEDIPVLLSMGKEHLYVWEMTSGMVHENDAAERLLALCGQENMIRSEVKEGKIELKAACDGVFLVDSSRLIAVNSQHSIGMSPNVRKKRTYDDLDYDMLSKTLDISAVSFHKMIQAAKKLDAIAEYGSILALSYVAAQRTFYGYNDMADAKALLESIARSFGYIYGREHHVRVNTISQSPTMTTAGSGVKGMDKLFDFANRMSPLGNASADECADYCIVMFSDLTRKVTMQNLYHDGGFSSVGMSLRAMATYEKGLDEYKDENGNIIYG